MSQLSFSPSAVALEKLWIAKMGLAKPLKAARGFANCSDMCLAVPGWFSWKEAMLLLRSQEKEACQTDSD